MQSKEELYSELKKEVKKANQRIARIEKTFGKAESWAVRKLISRIDIEPLQAWSSRERIKINSKMNINQLRRIQRATELFLSSNTSKIRGIKAQIKSIKQGFIKNLDITDEEAERIYQAFNEDLTSWIFRYIDPSTFWALVEEAKETNISKKSFIEMLKDYIDFGNDLDIIEKLESIYERYVA